MSAGLLSTVVLPMAAGGGEEEPAIEIGHHNVAELGPFTFHADTIWNTLLAAGIVLALGFIVRRALTRDTADHVPTKIQLVWESVVGEVNRQVEDNLGKVHPFVAPLAISLFFFILLCNWFELLPTKLNDDLHVTAPPTADVNLTYALALLVILSVWTYGIREKGVKGYFKHFVEPYPFLAPLNVLEELIKPLTLALRLFGNIFAGGIMLSLIALMPLYILWGPNVVWKLFEMFIGAIQAFIFALLTVLYFAMAGAGHGGDEHEEHEEHEERDETAPKDQKEPVPAA
jgi:F-type H+-transporting ATPase subunit a